jgi:DNA-binding transcriptional ArsR family regulator
VAHPTRRAILELLVGQKGLSPGSIAEKLEVGVANAKYHVDVLLACGAIEAVLEDGRRGERLVRLARSTRPRDQSRLDASGSMRDDVSVAQLKNLIEIAGDFPPGYDVRGA